MTAAGLGDARDRARAARARTSPRATGPTTRSPATWCTGSPRTPSVEFRVWSHTRPARHTMGDCDRLARGFAAGLAARGIREGDVVAFQMPNCFEAGDHLLRRGDARRGARADRPLLRPQGGRPHPARVRGQGVPHRRPLRPPRLRRPTSRAASEAPTTSSSWRSWATTAPRARSRFDDLVARRRRLHAGVPRPRRARGRRLHVGHHVGPEGRDPHAPHAQRRDDRT